MPQVSPSADVAVRNPDLSADRLDDLHESTFVPPKYAMKDVHAAIPPHCFQPNTLISLAYVLRDVSLALTLAFIATYIPSLSNFYLRLLSWATYSFCQGLTFTGLWELAHECGHGALSKHKSFNNSVGLTIHSFLLVPYHSWRFTHQTHHKSTNNLARDIAFVPVVKEEYLAAQAANPFSAIPCWNLIEDTPAVALITLLFHQLIAFPIYLTLNNFALERMRKAAWWKRSHFYFGGDGPNFRPWQSNEILISDLGIAVALGVLWASVRWAGAWNVFCWYGVPYLWVNHWILVITYLQHTDPLLPYYPASTHTFLRGAASTIDRDFGLIGMQLFHGATNFHVLHHHASRIPFYYSAEASKAMRTVMGSAYIADMESSYLGAWWRNYRTLRWVEKRKVEGDVVFFFEREKLDGKAKASRRGSGAKRVEKDEGAGRRNNDKAWECGK